MESIQTLNDRLAEHYGKDSDSSQPMFRIVWANDQIEKRLVTVLEESGIQLLTPTVRAVKKYAYLKDLYVLERLVIVPDLNSQELLEVKKSYEPIWAYCDASHQSVDPTWPATKLIVDTLYAALGKKSLRKYVEPDAATSIEGHRARVKKIQEELFGNETDVGDALAYREGVTVPSNYQGEK